jgi:hypothetical protein
MRATDTTPLKNISGSIEIIRRMYVLNTYNRIGRGAQTQRPPAAAKHGLTVNR